MGYWDTPGASVEWFTPKHIFDALGCEFEIDVASPIYYETLHVPAKRRIICNALTKPWLHEGRPAFIWMNPPFGGRNGIEPWLDRFFDHGNGIALAPDRTSAPWFWRAWQRAGRVLFTRKIRFLRPDGTEGVSPSNGTALFAVGVHGIRALRDAAAVDLGILAAPQSLEDQMQRTAA